LNEDILIGLGTIVVVGIVAQWIAWRFNLPSILLLLIAGFFVGPVTGWLNPDELLGDLLFPVVSISVALILFEGGLSLKLREVRTTGHVIRNLMTIGALVTWIIATLGAYWVLRFDLPVALLLGAILVVTGPTVIIPLLRHVQAVGRVSAIAKWEGIVNDPIGAILAVLVFEAIVASRERGVEAAANTVVISIVETVLIGLVLGGLSALLLILLLRRYWIPDYLQNSVALTLVVLAFVLSNLIQSESGLFTVTLMGIILANQRAASMKHIIEFKENLRVLLIASLFIILAARLKLEDLAYLGWGSLVFLAILILIARPASIFLSTIKSGLSWQEKLFLSWMAPRGIVAAAVTAVFALELAHEAGYTQAELMVPEMFVVIVGTVTIYGLTAAPVGRWLKVAQPNPQGVLLVGAHRWARAIAEALKKEGLQVLLVDTNRANIGNARLAGVPAYCASILSEHIIDELELGGLGYMLALTPNDEVNSLAALHFAEVFDRANIYQLPPKEIESSRRETVSQPLRGRLLFDAEFTYRALTRRFESGSVIKTTKLTEKFDYHAYLELYGDRAISLFLVDEMGNLIILSADNQPIPEPGQTVISLIDLEEEPIYSDSSIQPEPVR
jgi:NhaP-type Na+/H+ or K+/H+ antiporter